jgi:hypothetical protein
MGSVGSKLAEWFSNYFLALVLDFEYSGKIYHHIFSGFLVSLGELSLWVTAGHIIDNLKKDLSKPQVRIIRMRWWDRLPIPGAESIPINSGIEAFSSNEIGMPEMDFGFVRISGMEEMNLKKNNRVRFFTPQAWNKNENTTPEGYYLLGLPSETLIIKDNKMEQPEMLINFVSLPVTRISPKNSAAGEFWNDPDAFYGQILSFSDKNGYQPHDIVNMSGGPIISVERIKNSGISYRLFAIQRGWLHEKRIIRGEMLHRFLPIDMIKAFFSSDPKTEGK